MIVFVCLGIALASGAAYAADHGDGHQPASDGAESRSEAGSAAQSNDANLPGAAHKELIARAGAYTTRTALADENI
jgi:hypothetical protein